MKATEVATGLAESNGSLPPGGCHINVICKSTLYVTLVSLLCIVDDILSMMLYCHTLFHYLSHCKSLCLLTISL